MRKTLYEVMNNIFSGAADANETENVKFKAQRARFTVKSTTTRKKDAASKHLSEKAIIQQNSTLNFLKFTR